jgi:hypothetical protein
MAKTTEPQPITEPAEVALVERKPELVACDACLFQCAADGTAFFCLLRAPSPQRADSIGQWTRIERTGLPAFKGCGEGRRKKDAA